MDLFERTKDTLSKPLADLLRPTTLKDYVGQKHIIGEGKLLNELIKKDQIPSMVFWGPPGVGKTTLARIIANHTQQKFITLSAVSSGVKDVKKVIEDAQSNQSLQGIKTILFIDEIHRYNKAQQDAVLPYVENGTITLIGATTENPSFELNSALLSRCQVVVLKALEKSDQIEIINRALKYKNKSNFLDNKTKQFLVESAYGDARYLLNILEDLLNLFSDEEQISFEEAQSKIIKRSGLYDKNAEHHYNVISAFIKSMRGSDPDAALYYLARMLDAGEDPLFIARRMIIFASEDIGNANPTAVQVAISCMQSYDFIGLAEGWIPLSQCATYLACSPKSNSSYAGYKKALEDVKKYGPLEVPLHLRNAPTKLMKNLGYAKDYKYAHSYEGNIVRQQHLPDKIKQARYYIPTENGYEKKLKDWLNRSN